MKRGTAWSTCWVRANLFCFSVKPGQEALQTPPRVPFGSQRPEARFHLQPLRFLPVWPAEHPAQAALPLLVGKGWVG